MADGAVASRDTGRTATMTDSLIETTIAPWLAVSDGTSAVDFYREALGAVVTYSLDGDAGTVVVAQLTINGAPFWVQEDDASGPALGGSRTIRMILTVNDPDALFERAVAAGATLVASVHEEHGWRTGRVTDPFGHDWEFSKPLASE
jgi:PhnB protein